MNISDFDYDLPDERIARFPARERDSSKLLVWGGRKRDDDTPNRSDAKRGEDSLCSEISETVFSNIDSVLPGGSLLVFNNTRVVRARLAMRKPAAGGTVGARVEILCLEPADPADYERAFAARRSCEWICMVGNLKRWKSGPLEATTTVTDSAARNRGNGGTALRAWRVGENNNGEQRVRFEWDGDLTFGQLLELLGRMPIPPYLGRDSDEVDNTRYQTVYSLVEGSVAAPTAGLHFTPELIGQLGRAGIETEKVTLHVGAGTFLPVKVENPLDHPMHTEHFEVTLAAIEHLLAKFGHIIAVGTTSVRTLESLPALAYRIARTGDPETERPVGQFEPYGIPADFDGRAALETLAAWMKGRGSGSLKASTRIMITPAGLPPAARSQPSADTPDSVDETFRFRIVNGIVTNFHQPKSTLLLLIAAFTGGDAWRKIYDYALSHDFRFLSYGDSSLLL